MLGRSVGLVGAALVVSCGVDLTYPDGARVLCRSDDDCTAGSKCSATAGACIPDDDPDTSPRINSATATDSTHVVLLFSAPMQPELLGRLATYVIAPSIGVVAVSAADDGTSATLTTTVQRARPYLVTATALTDTLGRPLADDKTSFDGIGTPVDQTPPTPLSPPDGVRLSGGDVVLSWTQNLDAAVYTVEIANDPDFADIVRSEAVSATTLPLTLGDDTYYWRVRADVSEVSNAAVFAVVSTGLHVYCPGSAACVDDLATFRGGDPRHPLRDPSFAMAIASTLGVGTVRVARRAEDTTQDYAQALFILSTPLTVEGGYDASFASRDVTRPTGFSAAATVARIANASASRLSGLRLSGSAQSTEPIVEVIGSYGVELADTAILAGNVGAPPLRASQASLGVEGSVFAGVGNTAIDLTRVELRAAATSFSGHGLSTSESFVDLIDCEIAVAESSGATTSAIDARFTTLTLERTTVTATSANDVSTGLLYVSDSSLSVLRSRIVVGASAACTSLLCMQANAIYARNTPVIIADSLVSNTEGSHAVIVDDELGGGVIDLRIASSTLVQTAGAGPLQVLRAGAPVHFDVVNSVVVADGFAVPCLDGPVPDTLGNNAFVGCAPIVPGYPTVDAVNALAASTGMHVAGSFAPSETVTQLFPARAGRDGVLGTTDDDYGPVAGGPLDDRASLDLECGTAAAPTACPVSSVDIVGITRPTVPTVGAWEAR